MAKPPRDPIGSEAWSDHDEAVWDRLQALGPATDAEVLAVLRESYPSLGMEVVTESGRTITWNPNKAPKEEEPMTTESWEALAENNTPEELAQGFAAQAAENDRLKAEVERLKAGQQGQGQQGQQGQPDYAEATAQIKAIPRLVQDAGGHWIENPERMTKVQEILTKAGVTDRQYQEARWR